MRRSRPPSDLVLREIETLYRAGYPSFVRVVTGIVGSEEAARDAVHDGFVLVVQRASPAARLPAHERALRRPASPSREEFLDAARALRRMR